MVKSIPGINIYIDSNSNREPMALASKEEGGGGYI